MKPKTKMIVGFILACAGVGYWYSTEPDVALHNESIPSGGVEEELPVPTLNMSNQNLLNTPMAIFEHTELVVLNLSHNKLTGALPAEVRHLQELEWLDLSHNQFTGVPAEVGQLSKLRHLDLSHNQLTGLPHELGGLQKLETLILTGNDYAEHDVAVIRQNLPSSVLIVL
jgi:Leucine-rich repeat (LRR) protein